MIAFVFKAAAFLWIGVSSATVMGIVLQTIDGASTVFSASDLLLGTMIIGTYVMVDKRMRVLERNQARLLEHLKLKWND